MAKLKYSRTKAIELIRRNCSNKDWQYNTEVEEFLDKLLNNFQNDRVELKVWRAMSRGSDAREIINTILKEAFVDSHMEDYFDDYNSA